MRVVDNVGFDVKKQDIPGGGSGSGSGNGQPLATPEVIILDLDLNMSSGTLSVPDETKDLLDKMTESLFQGKIMSAFVRYSVNNLASSYFALSGIANNNKSVNYKFSTDDPASKIIIQPSTKERWIAVFEG